MHPVFPSPRFFTGNVIFGDGFPGPVYELGLCPPLCLPGRLRLISNLFIWFPLFIGHKMFILLAWGTEVCGRMVFSGLSFPSGLPGSGRVCILELVTDGRVFDSQVSFTVWDSANVGLR